MDWLSICLILCVLCYVFTTVQTEHLENVTPSQHTAYNPVNMAYNPVNMAYNPVDTAYNSIDMSNMSQTTHNGPTTRTVRETRSHGLVTLMLHETGGEMQTIKTHPTTYIMIHNNEHMNTPLTNIRMGRLNIVNEHNRELQNNKDYKIFRSVVGFADRMHDLPHSARNGWAHSVLIVLARPTILNRFSIMGLNAGPSQITIRCVGKNDKELGVYRINGGLGGANILS